MKKLVSKLVMVVFALTALVQQAGASIVIDQTTGDASDHSVGFFINTKVNVGAAGGLYKADSNNISGAGVDIFNENWPVNPSANITVTVTDLTTGLVLGSNTNDNIVVGWNDVFFADAPVTIGDELFVSASSDIDQAATVGLIFNGSGAGGVFTFLVGLAPLNYFTPLSALYVSRTYTDNAASNVPEPESMALVGLGLAGLGVMRRKAKKV